MNLTQSRQKARDDRTFISVVKWSRCVQMDYQEQQRALPFSIENILRKDFPPPSHLSKRPTQFQAASEKFTKGQTSWPLFSCCSVCYYLESRSLRASSSRLPGNFPRRRESTAVSEEQLPLFIKVPFKLEVKRTPAPEVKRVSAPPLPAVLQGKQLRPLC